MIMKAGLDTKIEIDGGVTTKMLETNRLWS